MLLEKITPLLLTYNEEANIGRALDKLTWAQRIVVLDSYSTDGTLDILQLYPQVDIIQRVFDNHTSQWNYGLDQIETEWILSLDADYILSPGFVNELFEIPDEASPVGYFSRFRYCILGNPLRGSLYPPRLLLFKNEKARYVQEGHTQRLRLNGESDTLRSLVYHDDQKTLNHWIEAQYRYIDLEVEKLVTTIPEELAWSDRLRRRKCLVPFLTPLYCLFVKGLLLDGWPGWYYTFQRTYAELLLALRLMDHDLRNASSSH